MLRLGFDSSVPRESVEIGMLEVKLRVGLRDAPVAIARELG